MNRISTRISAAFVGVKCPGCGNHVIPTVPAGDAAASKPGERFSFVWRPPSGEVCPRCGFPLARFAKRVKWIRLFALGVITVGVAMVLLVLLGGEVDLTWVSTLVRVLLGLGGLAIIVGLTGLIVGGRRSVPEQEAPKA
jgi:predicted RNA-binding Zn-ribbon protein involved in translation (DUF1610 family)